MKRILFFALLLAMLPALSGCNLSSNPAALATPILPALALGIQAQNASAGFSSPGQVLQYRYTVTNTGTAALQGTLAISDDKVIPVTCPDIKNVGNLNASLDPAEIVICIGSYTVTQADVTAGAVTNTATASMGGAISSPASAIVRAGNKVLMLTKTSSPASFSQAGQTITFNYTITNTGTAPIGPTQFVVSDDHVTSPVNCGAPNTTLVQNQAVACSSFYTTTQADVTAGSVTSSATASGGGASTMGTASNTLSLAGGTAGTPGTPGIPVTSSYTAGSTVQYKVIEGEWLIQIARCFGADPAAISKANPQIVDPDEIDPGEILSIPNVGSKGKIYGPPCIGSHTVQSGDTWNSIAQKYNADVAVLQLANKGASLTPGTVLRIPLNSAGGTASTGATQVVTPTTPVPTVCNQAQMVADVNMPDGTTVSAAAAFTKTWRLKNVGTCTWTSAFSLVYDHGERMDAPPSTILTTVNVSPGATVDVSVPLKAPAAAGTYQADFKLRAADGSTFGIGSNAQGTFWVNIVVPGPGGTVIPTATTAVATPIPATATSTTSASLPEVVQLLGRKTANDPVVANFLAANTDGQCPETEPGSRLLECKSPSHSAPYIRLKVGPNGGLGDAPIQEVRIFQLFPGPLPEGLNWNMTRAGVELKLGAPLGTPQDNGNGTVDVEYKTASGTYRLFVTFDATGDPNTTAVKRMRIDPK